MEALIAADTLSAERPIDAVPRRRARTRVDVTPDDHLVIDATLKALAFDGSLYQRADSLVHVVREPADADDEGIHRSAGTPRIRRVSAGFLRERISTFCEFWRMARRRVEQCSPPPWCVSAIHDRGHWPMVRRLSGITEMPTLRPDGTILTQQGWDQQTGLLYLPDGPVPQIPDEPNRDDALTAARMLLELVRDFPFASPTHRASWLAGLLTVLARRAFTGPAPLFLIDANVRGSGKSLLTDVIAMIATGRSMPRMSNPGDDDEARKRITSLAIAGDPLVLIDNIAATLGSAALDAVLTSTDWRDRKLGANEMVEHPMRAVWFATGNNVVLLADTSRRVCHVRLDSPLEAPEERTGFRHPNLLRHVRSNRLSLLAAGLTILRAYVVAGLPDSRLKPWGSFEGWSALIRNCIAWLDLPDPGETRRELAEASDRDAAALRALCTGWSDIDVDGKGLTAAELVKLLAGNEDRYCGVRDALAELCGTTGAKSPTPRQIGTQLRRFKGRVVGGKKLDYLEGRSRMRLWRVVTLANGDNGDNGDSVSDSHARDEIDF